MADLGSPRVGAPISEGLGANLLFGIVFVKICMRMKKNWTGANPSRPLDPPLEMKCLCSDGEPEKGKIIMSLLYSKRPLLRMS